ncbi:MAG: nucleoside diphosphate kinase regulator [Betaproteobacteria bacterium]
MTNTIYITALDQRRLQVLADALTGNTYMERYATMLVDVLESAKVVTSEAIPADVVTMNSVLRYADTTAHSAKEITLVYPEEADTAQGKVSVLSPIGNTLLGMKVGETASLRLPHGGERAIRVLRIVYQPEAEGHLTT